MGMPVSPVAVPRVSATPYEESTARPFVIVDGAAAAGSKHLLGSADALVEQTRLQLTDDDAAKTIIVHNEQAQGSHAWTALVTIDPGDDIAAADNLNAGWPDVHVVLPGTSREFNLASASRNLYVIGMPAVGATAASCKGRIWVEVKSHA